MIAKEENRAAYGSSAEEDLVIEQALEILRNRLGTRGVTLSSPQSVIRFLTLKLAGEESEKFSIILLDAKHRVIEYVVAFHGGIDSAGVYPRELVKLALKHNAAAAIIAHNHPSGIAEPSDADIKLTKKVKEALELVEVRLLDHFIIGGCANLMYTSLAELGHV